jgi:YbgC/YbaW family acyl-CoA thioester hydrolase
VPLNETGKGLLPSDTRSELTPEGMVVRHAVTVEWGDCDPAGIIYYPTYFKWWDQGSWRLFWAAGINRRIMHDMGGFEMPILNAAGTFESTVMPGDQLVVESRVERWGNSSFRIAHRVMKRDGTTAAHGHETRCWITVDVATPGKFKATRIPDDVITRLGGTRA